MSPKVSIIVPCYNTEVYLDRCVKSLVQQTLKDIEIILVDDGSPDCVPEICDRWALQDSRITVIHKKNEGLGMACNTGIEAAKGEFIAFCDSDDWVDAEMYETMYNATTAYDVQMVLTGIKRVDINGNVIGQLPHRKYIEVLKTREHIETLALDMIASTPSIREDRTIQMSAKVVLYSHMIIKFYNCRFVNERKVPSEDLHFNLNFLSHCNRVCSLPYRFYNYLVNANSISRKPNPNRFFMCKMLYYYIEKECRKLNFKEEFIIRNQRLLLGQARSCVKLCLQWNIPLKEKKRIINTITNDEIWIDIFKEYPINQMPLPHQIFTYAMKFKYTNIMALLMKFN